MRQKRYLLLYSSVVGYVGAKVRVMMFNATFNNISAISWWSVLLVEETGVPGENHRSATVLSMPHHEHDSNSQF
jgi:hypothetical protein